MKLGWVIRLLTASRRYKKSSIQKRDPRKSEPLSGAFALDIEHLKSIFDRSSDIVYREFNIGRMQKGVLIFLEGLVNLKMIDEDILKPLLEYGKSMPQPSNLRLKDMEKLLQDQIISVAQVNRGESFQEIVDYVLSGDTALLIEGASKAFFFSTKEWEKRSVEEPATEAVIRGPREGFTENLRTNTSLIRRRLKTPQLKMEGLTVGRLSKTEIVITYLDGIVDEAIVTEVRERIGRIDIDAILESGYIEEWIEDNPYSVFPQVQNTERPDKVVGHLLEGKVGIIIDNTPFALIVPVTFFDMMQASEDYYQRYFVSTAIRWLRYMFVVTALLLPSLYIALLTFHQEMLPTNLLLSVAASRETVPFPAIVEAMLMEVSFEGLREAGVRLPRPVGQAVSIVGALVIGQAAVQAGLVSAPMVIVVSITGIASFTMPSFSQSIAIRLLRFPMMVAAGTLGIYGVLMGTLIILIHMTRLRSFGVPYMSPAAPLQFSDLKDVLIRMPWWGMVERPEQTGKKNPQRMKNRFRPDPPSRGE
ncbi:spore germination protein [Cohnella silvisoli]|uniref:Spore germination protein n=1 Tax=Cohnella silvisoli TaxID=2873699 RepID=A0ABV1KTL0_9BACL|nr:spore germination protein [Cohnella silvisoli]MCD9022871.1 spore germination protein [Cohnella silvisoli]